jgi:hypothetical protein
MWLLKLLVIVLTKKFYHIEINVGLATLSLSGKTIVSIDVIL